MERKSICIGIPCFAGVDYKILEDYMRFAFYLGRRYQEYDFFLAIIGKKEQFRARNAIVEEALKYDSDYILMLDDDHVIDIEDSPHPTLRYEFLRKMINHLEEDPIKGIVGALYFQRGGNCYPVIMQKNKEGEHFFITHMEIARGLQKCNVTGGGCMLLRKEIFDKIPSPWFEPEFDQGTDIQICDKTIRAGFTVWCDSSIEIGHVVAEREVLSSKTMAQKKPKARKEIEKRLGELDLKNRKRREDLEKKLTEASLEQSTARIDLEWINSFKQDATKYTKMSLTDMLKRGEMYPVKHHSRFFEYPDKTEYYRSIGMDQLYRQVWYHNAPMIIDEGNQILGYFDKKVKGRGLDYACGCAPIGYELLSRGAEMDFVDIDGCSGYEFLKWRIEKNGNDLKKRAGWILNRDYTFVLLLDALEHFPEPDKVLKDIISRMKQKSMIVTNYFRNNDRRNPEHIGLNHAVVEKTLKETGFKLVTAHYYYMWVRED